jgi:hypothetical protein
MERYDYFPSSVYRDEQPEWVDYTKQVVQTYYDTVASNNTVDQTHYMANNPKLRFLADYFLLSAEAILREQGYDVDKYVLYLAGMWGQDLKCNGSTDVHIHKSSQISGWFFLETPEGGSYPVYHEPRMNKQMIELDYVQGPALTSASSLVHFNNVKPGTVIMANSWMRHQLTYNTSKEQTKSIHFVVSHKDRACNIC